MNADTSVLLLSCFFWLLGREPAQTPRVDRTLRLRSRSFATAAVLATCLMVGTSRLGHACTDRPVSMSGGSLPLSSTHQTLLAVRSPSRFPLSFSHPVSQFWHLSILGLKDLGLLLDDPLGLPHFSLATTCCPSTTRLMES